MPTLSTGGGSRHPPMHNGEHTSPWFALHYVHTHIPNISVHDLVKLVASIGQETHGKYTYEGVVNATHSYQHDKSMPDVGTAWVGHVSDVIKAAARHGQPGLVKGFSYTGKDIPGSGGKSNLQKISDSGAANGVISATKSVGGVLGGFSSLLSNPTYLLIIIVLIVVLVVKK